MARPKDRRATRYFVGILLLAVLALISFYSYDSYQKRTGEIQRTIIKNQALAIKLYSIRLANWSTLFSAISQFNSSNWPLLLSELKTLQTNINNIKTEFVAKWNTPQDSITIQFDSILSELSKASVDLYSSLQLLSQDSSNQRAIQEIITAFNLLWESQHNYLLLQRKLEHSFKIKMAALTIVDGSQQHVANLANQWALNVESSFSQPLQLQIIAWAISPNPINFNGQIAMLPATNQITVTCVTSLTSNQSQKYNVLIAVQATNQQTGAQLKTSQYLTQKTNSSLSTTLKLNNLNSGIYQLNIFATIPNTAIKANQNAIIQLP